MGTSGTTASRPLISFSLQRADARCTFLVIQTIIKIKLSSALERITSLPLKKRGSSDVNVGRESAAVTDRAATAAELS